MLVATTSFSQTLLKVNQYASLISHQSMIFGLALNPTASPEKEFLDGLKSHIAGLAAHKRILEYNLLIISTYGALEKFIEGVMQEYLTSIVGFATSFQDLPSEIQKNHTELSVKLATRVRQSPGLSAATEAEIFARINSCLNNPEDFKLNVEAFSLHTANFRTEVINTLFAAVGIGGIAKRINAHNRFKQYLSTKDPGQQIGLDRDNVFPFLEDLCERRNEVAHGNVNNVNLYIINDYVEFTNAFGAALSDILERESLTYKWSRTSQPLGHPDESYPKISVIGYRTLPLACSVGDAIATTISRDTAPIEVGEIVEIRVNGVDQNNAKSGDPNVTLRVSVPFSARSRFRVASRIAHQVS